MENGWWFLWSSKWLVAEGFGINWFSIWVDLSRRPHALKLISFSLSIRFESSNIPIEPIRTHDSWQSTCRCDSCWPFGKHKYLLILSKCVTMTDASIQIRIESKQMNRQRRETNWHLAFGHPCFRNGSFSHRAHWCVADVCGLHFLKHSTKCLFWKTIYFRPYFSRWCVSPFRYALFICSSNADWRPIGRLTK